MKFGLSNWLTISKFIGAEELCFNQVVMILKYFESVFWGGFLFQIGIELFLHVNN
ncbi:hypothetical protein MNBD_ALPHA11-1518, partial [hydrothermal vent metagenome]